MRKGEVGNARNPHAPTGATNPDGSYTQSTGAGTFDRFVQNKSQCTDHEADTPTSSASGGYLGRTCQFSASGG